MTKLDDIITGIFDVLTEAPATTMKEIVTKINRATRMGVDLGDVNNALTQLRRHSAEWGFTVPHVKRGKAKATDKGRYFVMEVDRHGEYVLSDPLKVIHFDSGMLATFRQSKTMLEVVAAAARLGVTHTRSTSQKAKLTDRADDCTYAARKLATLIREMEEAA